MLQSHSRPSGAHVPSCLLSWRGSGKVFCVVTPLDEVGGCRIQLQVPQNRPHPQPGPMGAWESVPAWGRNPPGGHFTARPARAELR